MTRVSVVIPTLDEADRLAPLVDALRREPELAEIIVADGMACQVLLSARVASERRDR